MILTKKGDTEMHGRTQELMADLSIIVHAMVYDMLIDRDKMTLEEAKRMIIEQVEYGMMSEEQIEREADAARGKAKDILECMAQEIADAIKRVFE